MQIWAFFEYLQLALNFSQMLVSSKLQNSSDKILKSPLPKFSNCDVLVFAIVALDRGIAKKSNYLIAWAKLFIESVLCLIALLAPSK